MTIESYNLPYYLYKAENAQLFQHQYLVQERAFQTAMSEQTKEFAKASEEHVFDVKQTEDEPIRTEEDRRQPPPQHRRRRRKIPKKEKEEEEEEKLNPEGEGTIIDITI